MEQEQWRWGRKHTLMALSLLFGWVGMDRFYEGQVGWGILKAVTFGGLFVWWWIDAIIYTLRAGKRE